VRAEPFRLRLLDAVHLFELLELLDVFQLLEIRKFCVGSGLLSVAGSGRWRRRATGAGRMRRRLGHQATTRRSNGGRRWDRKSRGVKKLVHHAGRDRSSTFLHELRVLRQATHLTLLLRRRRDALRHPYKCGYRVKRRPASAKKLGPRDSRTRIAE
jgi:hypothetical protein